MSNDPVEGLTCQLDRFVCGVARKSPLLPVGPELSIMTVPEGCVDPGLLLSGSAPGGRGSDSATGADESGDKLVDVVVGSAWVELVVLDTLTEPDSVASTA